MLPEPPSLPTFEISPVPEQIFLATVKGLLSFVVNLSFLDLSLFLAIVLLVHANASTRQKAAVFQGFFLLIFGLEVSFVNLYALVRNSTTEIDGEGLKTLSTNILKAMLVVFSFDYSRAPHGRYHGNTQRRHTNHYRLRPITTHRHRENRTFQIALAARPDHGPARPSQVRSFGQYGNIYCGLRRVCDELCYNPRRRSGHEYLGFRTSAEHADRLRFTGHR